MSMRGNRQHGNSLTHKERKARETRISQIAWDKLCKREQFERESRFFNADGLWVMGDDEKNWRNAGSNGITIVPKRNLRDACLEARRLYNLCIEIDVSGQTTSKIPFDQPDAVIKRAIYQIGMICRKYELHDELDQLSNNAASKAVAETRNGNNSHKLGESAQLTTSLPKLDIDRRRLPKNAPPSSENPFYHVFHVTLPETAVIKKPSANLKKVDITNSRMKIAQTLLYAELHDVPVELLTGFINQVGGDDIIAKRLKGQLPTHSKLPVTTHPSDIKENWFTWKRYHPC